MGIEESFVAFDDANPWVMKKLIVMARQLHKRGRKHIGIKMLFEVLRWDYMTQTSDPTSDFKLNNNYHSRYARAIMDKCPDLDGFFRLRELKAN